MLISMKLISMNKTMKNKKYKHLKLRLIAGLLCLCIGIISISVTMSWAWIISNDDFESEKELLGFYTKKAFWLWVKADDEETTDEETSGDSEFEELSDAIEGLGAWGIFEVGAGKAGNGQTGDIWAEIGEPDVNEADFYEEDGGGAASIDNTGGESALEDAFAVGVANDIEDADNTTAGDDFEAAAGLAVFEVWSYDVGYGYDE